MKKLAKFQLLELADPTLLAERATMLAALKATQAWMNGEPDRNDIAEIAELIADAIDLAEGDE